MNQNEEGRGALIKVIWLYIILLIFEGALRKWIIPRYADPILLIRDPVVIVIYALALKDRLFPWNGWLTSLSAIAALSFFVSVVAGSAWFVVILFGLRTDFMHIPLLFLMAELLRPDDVRRIGSFFLYLAAPMTVLMVLQFAAPPDSWLQAGASKGATQLETALGKLRPSGPFSYNSGITQYWVVASAFLFAGWARKLYPKWLLLVASGSLILAVAVSGSRGCFLAVAIVVIVAGLVSFKPGNIWRAVGTVAAFSLVMAVVVRLGVFREGLETMTARFDEASEFEGADAGSGLTARVLKGFTDPFTQATLFGVGLGVGTNVGAKMMVGQVVYLVAEGEWGRLLGEGGWVAGLPLIVWRSACTLYLLVAAIRGRRHSPLALLLFAACGEFMLEGQWGQATSLGFTAVGCGLCLAAAKAPVTAESDPQHDEPEPQPTVSRLRGRSAYAEKLHR